MMKTLNNNVFNSIYFLISETNVINKYNNIIENNYERNLIQNIINDKGHLLTKDNILKENVSSSSTPFPLIRKTSIHLKNNVNDEDEPQYLLYFLSGIFFNKNSQKTIEFLKDCKPTLTINPPVYQYFITNASEKGGLIFFEDSIINNFNTIHTIVDDNFDIVKDNTKKELRAIYLQNNLIMELGEFFNIIFEDNLIHWQKLYDVNKFYKLDNLLLLTYPSILANNIKYQIPKSLLKTQEVLSLGLFELLAFANLKNYIELRFNLNGKENKNKLNKVMLQTILTYCLHPYITDEYFEKENNHDKQYLEDKNRYIEFAKCLNSIIDMWSSTDFKTTPFEYQYYYAFRPYEVSYS